MRRSGRSGESVNPPLVNRTQGRERAKTLNLLFAPHHGLQGLRDGLGLRPGAQRLARPIKQLLVKEEGLLVSAGPAARVLGAAFALALRVVIGRLEVAV